MKKIPNLDTLRFIAASLVIIHHVELYKQSFSIENYFHIPFIKVIGKLGVVLFFVLSGFLITTLLLNEKEKKGEISFKKFYIRRILRIWPVYYLIIFLGFFVFPHIPLLKFPGQSFHEGIETIPMNFLLYLTIFANVGWAIFGNIPYTTQTWSLATEEQFYLIWPFIVNYFNKALLLVMLFVILFYHGALYFLWTEYANYIPYHTYLSRFLYAFNVNCMAIGGIFAVLVYQRNKVVDFIFNRVFFWSVVIITIMFLLYGKYFGNYQYDVYSVLFGIIIANLAFNKKLETVMENRITNYLGSISYGLYMFHAVAVVIAIRVSIYFNTDWIIYPLTFLLTILVSHLSYKYFEGYFLRFKIKFNNI
ncbi:MAG: acyltransferase [Bacteroidetes bacterium]|nr:acyltransferase [Bacteroidota bacterium]